MKWILENAAPAFVDVRYDHVSLLIREFTNGVWTISSCILFGIVSAYAVQSIREYERWWEDPPTQFAIALAVFTLGHVIRSAGQWGAFIIANAGLHSSLFTTWEYLVVATEVIVLGKCLCIWMMTTKPWRWLFIGSLLALSLVIPLVVMVAL